METNQKPWKTMKPTWNQPKPLKTYKNRHGTMKNQSGTIKTNLELDRVVYGGFWWLQETPRRKWWFFVTNKQTLHHNIYIIIIITIIIIILPQWGTQGAIFRKDFLSTLRISRQGPSDQLWLHEAACDQPEPAGERGEEEEQLLCRLSHPLQVPLSCTLNY